MKNLLAWRRLLLPILLWVVFGSGVLLQVLAPGLKIKDNAFVIPPSLLAADHQVHPAQIIARERKLKVLSALLTLSGAIGLAFYYRRVLVRRSSS